MSTIVTARQQIFAAIQLNTNHQYALEKYNQRLAAELQEIDKLLAAADVGESDDEIGDVDIIGAIRPTGPIPETEFLNPASPFYSEAIKRSKYINSTITHPMKPRELEMLTEAVTAEFRRLRALESTQNRTNEPIDLTADVSKLNWKTIAEKVTDVSAFARTDRECKTKWLGYHRPGINHDEWTSNELEKLEEIIAEKEKEKNCKLNWVKIAQELATNRTPMDCMRKGLDRARHTWTAEADRKLVEGVQVYGLENWGLVALYVSPHVSSHQCQMRYIRSHDLSLKKSTWTSDEDARLNTLISVLGTSDWTDVARHMPGRTNDMCRERYTEGRKGKGKAKTTMEGEGEGEGEAQDSNQEREATEKAGTSRRIDWTEEQDMELIRLAGELGSKWQKISEAMGGVYNNNQCRARFSRLKNENKVEDTVLAETRPKHNKWTAEEDAELIRMVGEMGKQWLKISQAMGGVRNNDQCRTRYSRLKKENKVESIEADPTTNLIMTPSVSTSSPALHNPPVSTPMSTSASQPSVSTSTSVTAVTPTPTLPKPRPRPKLKPKARSRTESLLPTSSDTSNCVSSSSGNAATSSMLTVSSATGKRPSRRTTTLVSAVDLDILESIGAGTPVPPMGASESQDAVGSTVLNADGVNVQSQTETEPRDSPSEMPLRRSSRRSQVQPAAMANSSSASAIGVSSQFVVTADTPAAILTSNTSTRKHPREELSNPVLLSLTKTGDTGNPSPSHSPTRKKGRTRKSTAEGNIPTIETSSTPSGSSAVRRRSSRLSGKD